MTIQGREYLVTREAVLDVAKKNEPESIVTFYAEVNGKRFPPTQLIRLVTRTRNQVQSFNARSALTKLGFEIKSLT